MSLLAAASAPRPAMAADAWVLVIADDTGLVADGADSTGLTLWTSDLAGQPLPDGRVLDLTSDLGSVLDVTPVAGGMATARFVAGTWPDVATLSATGCDLLGDRILTLSGGEATSTTLHLHASFSEGNGTMLGHTLEAEGQGIDLLWWTDHDYYYYSDHQPELVGFDFEAGTLSHQMTTWPSDQTTEHQWKTILSTFANPVSVVTGAARHSGGYGWRLRGAGDGSEDWLQSSYGLDGLPLPLNVKPVMAQLDFGFWVYPRTRLSADAELSVDVVLSGSLDEMPRRIHFYDSRTDYSALDDTNDRYVRIAAPRGTWTHVTADITALAEESFPDIGQDLHAVFCYTTVRARASGIAGYDLDDFHWGQQVVGDALRDLQRAYLETLPYPTRHLVGTEVSMFPGTEHLGAFGSDSPFFPYFDRQDWTLSDAVAWVQDHGGAVAYNHLFGIGIEAGDEVGRAARVADVQDRLLAASAYGCDLLEVGYRERGGMTVDFLEVWDALSMAGTWITGIGANDSHAQSDWDVLSNNFVTWFPTASGSESDLLGAMRRGLAWFGDPRLFAGADVDVFLGDLDAQAVAGQVVVGAAGPRQIRFRASSLQEGWLVHWVRDGAALDSTVVDAAGEWEQEVALDPEGGAVVRVEVWTAEGAPALFSNPLYYVEDALPGEVPLERTPLP